MKKVDVVFVVLTYRNTTDIVEFIESVKRQGIDYQIVIVNSYYDDSSRDEIEVIAGRNHCDFLNIPNKGYSYGNNRGIEFANQNYEYKFLIVSNPDIIVQEFPDLSQYQEKSLLIGPAITNAKGKEQNPLVPWRCKFSEKNLYAAFRKDSKIRFFVGIATNRVLREIFLLRRKGRRKVYALHGSFVIFSKKALNVLGLPYDENMFLFAEESVLALKAQKMKVPSYVMKDIKVFHKEDGSMSFEPGNTYNNLKEANIYYYETYCRK